MEVHRHIAGFRSSLDAERSAGRTVGLVPTMGALHAGHLSLVERAAAACHTVALTIFVNPLQFGPGEDLDRYPRDLDRDVAVAADAGADLVFAPPVEEMYRQPVRTTVSVAGVSEHMEGAARPTHLAGVATVVAKLFAIAGPCHAFFGEKDFQQLVVIRELVRDLSFPVEVVGCPTVREPDGLALSSRNVHLTPEQRAAAPVLHRALLAGAAIVRAGERRAAEVRRAMTAELDQVPLAQVDYAEVVDAAMLTQDPVGGEIRLLVAARFGTTRLLDNVGVLAD